MKEGFLNFNNKITHEISFKTKNEKLGFLCVKKKPNGEFVFAQHNDSICGWFISDTSIYINTYRVNTTTITSLVFKQQSLPYTVVPLSHYSERQEQPEKSEYRNTLCDSFVSVVNLNSIQFKSYSFGVSKINRLLEKCDYGNVNIKSRPAPSQYGQQSEFVSIIYAEKGFATVQISDSEYGCGAAHGMFSTHYLNYSFVLGDTISLTDIVRAEAIDKLGAIVEQKFVARYREPEEGWSFHLTSNFAVLRSGLLFKYQVYEMGPFAAGDMEVFVPYSDITPLLNDTPVTKAIVAHF